MTRNEEKQKRKRGENRFKRRSGRGAGSTGSARVL
jgi:hypothetical protein